MWNGWVSYAGNEFINVQRTETYAKNDGASWFKPVYRADTLAEVLGDTPYRSPLQDDSPPWVDPNESSSYEFYGVYPLDISGAEDSTRASSVQEFVTDGGLAGRLRHGTRTIVFNTLLMGSNDAAVEYGLRWLKSLLLGGACVGRADLSCGGADLCYFASEPQIEDTYECAVSYDRTLKKVVFTSGPVVMQKNVLTDGSNVWQVQFTAVAGSPWEFGAEYPIAQGIFDSHVANPMNVTVDGVVIDPSRGISGGSFPDYVTPPVVDPDDIVSIDNAPTIYVEKPCPVLTYQPLFNPSCPALIAPPGVPSIPVSCFPMPANWDRRAFTIPAALIPAYGTVVPKIVLTALQQDCKGVRIRFYADPDGEGDWTSDPCNYCGDLIVTWIPLGGSIVIDGTTQTVTADVQGGGQRRADSLVIASDGGPFQWPLLTCGMNYIVTVDVLRTAKPPVIDMSVYSRAY